MKILFKGLFRCTNKRKLLGSVCCVVDCVALLPSAILITLVVHLVLITPTPLPEPVCDGNKKNYTNKWNSPYTDAHIYAQKYKREKYKYNFASVTLFRGILGVSYHKLK